MAKYLSIHRPISIGTYPKVTGNNVLSIENFDDRKAVGEHMGWGVIEYETPLNPEVAIDYELIKI